MPYTLDQLNELSKKDPERCFVCTMSGYLYDPEKGDPDADIAPGTPFFKLPDDWYCPWCGVDKSLFAPADEDGSPLS